MNQYKLLRSFLVLALLVLAGCSPASIPTPTTTLTPANTPAGPTSQPQSKIPDGIYSTEITKDEMVSLGANQSFICENAGTFSLTITGDQWSALQTALPGCTVQWPTDQGSLAFSGDQITFNGSGQNNGCSSVFTYQWSLNGSELHFSVVDDSCTARMFSMIRHSWVQKD